MKEELISFETAKLAKEKGFKIPCHSYYFEDGEFRKHKIETTNGHYGDTVTYEQEEFYENWNSSSLTTKDGDRCFGCNKSQRYFETYSAPSQSLLQKWLREKHKIIVFVRPKMHLIFEACVVTHDDWLICNSRENNWEYILEEGLIEALKLIKIY